MYSNVQSWWWSRAGGIDQKYDPLFPSTSPIRTPWSIGMVFWPRFMPIGGFFLMCWKGVCVWGAEIPKISPEKGRVFVLPRKLVAVNFHQLETPKTSHSCLKKWYFPRFSRYPFFSLLWINLPRFSAADDLGICCTDKYNRTEEAFRDLDEKRCNGSRFGWRMGSQDIVSG